MLPILGWIKLLCDHVTQTLPGSTELEFVWRHKEVIDPTVQRENLVAFVNSGMMTSRRAAEIMGETLRADPMADVLTVTTWQGVVRLGGNLVQTGVKKRDADFPSRLFDNLSLGKLIPTSHATIMGDGRPRALPQWN